MARAKKLWREVKALPPHEWVSFEGAFDRMLKHVAWELVERDLRQDILDRRLIAAARDIASDGTETRMILDPIFFEPLTIWRSSPKERVFVDGTRPVGHYFFVRRRELDKHYPTAQSSGRPTDPLQPPPRRRGPVVTHDWFSICGEIACRCINPKNGRVEVPKNENKLAEDVLERLSEQGINEPASSEMRKAVKRVCAALRAVQK